MSGSDHGPEKSRPLWAARWRLLGPPVPLTQTVILGALARDAAMSVARNLLGPSAIPWSISGHDIPDDAKHEHVFYLPEDADDDGTIDHLTIAQRNGFAPEALATLNALKRLFRGNAEWQLDPVGTAWLGNPLGTLIQPATTWVSQTPFVAPRHVKKRFAVPQQVLWQWGDVGLAFGQLLELVPATDGTRFGWRPRDFDWVRPGKDSSPPDRFGSYWHIRVPAAVIGPVALGFNNHYGLGLFRPLVNGNEP